MGGAEEVREERINIVLISHSRLSGSDAIYGASNWRQNNAIRQEPFRRKYKENQENDILSSCPFRLYTFKNL
jgi:hypothetical protein